MEIEARVIEKLVEVIYRYKTDQLELEKALALLNMKEEMFLSLCEKRGDLICKVYDGEYKILVGIDLGKGDDFSGTA